MVHCHKGYNFTRDFWYYHILCVCAIPIYTIYRLYDECTHILIFYFLFVMVVPSSYIWNITVLFSLKLLSCLCRLLRHSWLSIHMECTYRKDRVRERMNRGLSMNTNKILPMRALTVNTSVDSSS